MIFQHTWEQVISGQKTQTRRLVKPNQEYDRWERSIYSRTLRLLPLPHHMVGRKKTLYQVGKTYAVQPGRTKKAIARIRITNIERQRNVRLISGLDAQAEGFNNSAEFWAVWAEMHDKQAFRYIGQMRSWKPTRNDFIEALTGNKELIEWFDECPRQLYDAWVLTFELVK